MSTETKLRWTQSAPDLQWYGFYTVTPDGVRIEVIREFSGSWIFFIIKDKVYHNNTSYTTRFFAREAALEYLETIKDTIK